MDTITTIRSLLKSNGSAQPVTVALMPNDMRLIAAAPDLLEALKEVVSEYDNPDNGRTLRWAVDEARVAIARATGEAP